MDTGSVVTWLVGMTLAAVLVIGVFQYTRARRSQAKRGEKPGDARPTKR